MRLGISSYTYGWAVGVEGSRPARAMTAIQLIDRAAELGVGVLQICDNLLTETYTDASVEAIAAHAAQRGVAMELGTRGMGEAHLRRFIALARRLGSPILRVVVDTPGDHPPPEQVVERLRAILAELEKANVVLAIENHDRFRSRVLVSILKALSSPLVGICLDTVNSFGALEGPEVVVEALGPYVANLHLKDFAVRRLPHLQGFAVEGRPAGEGMLDVPWLLGRLREMKRDPNAILEQWTPPEPTIEATIEKECRWAERGVRTLRQWIKQ